ncbi:MAG: hypothetical protein ACT443_14395, partial [Gemmatimonadota bacterium]
MKRICYARRLTALTVLGIGLSASASMAQAVESGVEREARLARRGAGLRAGVWNVREPAGGPVSSMPHIEGYFQRGLDRYLALESSVGVSWRKRIETQALGNEVESRTYLVPLFTALKFYPFTTVENALDPFITGGVGFALGIDDAGENAIG